MLDHSPTWLLIVLAGALWVFALFVMAYGSRDRIKLTAENFFAQRRHNRRIRRYANGRTLYDINTTGKPQVYYAPVRRHR